jgi:hypothetical protein
MARKNSNSFHRNNRQLANNLSNTIIPPLFLRTGKLIDLAGNREAIFLEDWLYNFSKFPLCNWIREKVGGLG